MQLTALFSLVFFATLTSRVQAASDACCGCPTDGFFASSNLCPDGTECTPYCGYGPCNVFGCNCDGGCRGGNARRSRSIAHAGLVSTGTTEDYFNTADTDNDGQLTYEEWAASVQNTNMDKDALAARWAKFDSGNVGYLTKTEAASRVA
ncbi:hypothetical protein BD779DRAFT_1674168 [Infundibulicybe gibba]|nr:hypothetical protein BD779DRAFT_1674168 [Infundibulicybe gibba]